MMEHGVASLPVYDNATYQPLGIVDVRLIAAYLVWSKFRVNGDAHATIDPQVDFSKQLVASLLSTTSRPLGIMKGTDPVCAAVERMSSGTHHITVQLPPPHSAQRLLSRTDLVRWVCSFPQCFTLFSHTLADLGLCTSARKVVFMYDDETALDGLRRLSDCGLGALPVIDRRTGVMVATLSCSVVRYLDLTTVGDIRMPVLEFMRKYHPPSLQPLLCKPSDTLLASARNILAHKVHCAWIADAAQRPVACLSLSDVLRATRMESITEPVQANTGATVGRRASMAVSLS